MTDPLNSIRESVGKGDIVYSLHAIEEMSEEGIAFEEIHSAVLARESAIIESRTDDPRGESHLIFGLTLKGHPLHVVFGIAQRPIKIVTVYRPDLHPERWESDFRSRRRTP